MDRTASFNSNFIGRRSQKGFTLLELLVSILCLSLIVGTVAVSFQSQMMTENREQRILDVQMNSRVAMEELTELFRHAGYGATDSFGAGKTMSGNDPDGGTIILNSFLRITNGYSVGTLLSPDEVIVVRGFKRVALVDGYQEATASVSLDNLDTPQITADISGFKRFLTFGPYLENVFFEVKTVGGTDIPFTIDTNVRRLVDNAEVYMVVPIRVRVGDDNILLMQNFAYASSFDWEIADGIEDLQLQYTTDSGTTWVDNPVKPADVQGVRVFLLARAGEEDPSYTDSRTYDLAGQQVGPFNDGFQRELISTTVWLRN